MKILHFFNDLLFKMTWLNDGVSRLLLDVFNMNESTKLYGILQFFIYDIIKILILLSVSIFIISWIQSYFPPERTTKILQKYKGVKGNIIGALLGTLTPFCSCSSIPLFIGFTRAGLPLGITFSFLISSPLVDFASFLIIVGFFGWEIAVIYVIVGLILAVVGGTLIDKAKMEEHLEDYVLALRNQAMTAEYIEIEMSKKDRFDYSVDQVKDIVKKIWLYIIIGVGIGAAIHNVIPQTFIEAVLGDNNPFSVILATLFGIPIYADIFGTIPIAEALYYKGVGVGTIIVLMMSVTALSLPSMVMLSKVIKRKLLYTFIGIVAAGIVIIGYVLNFFEFLL